MNIGHPRAIRTTVFLLVTLVLVGSSEVLAQSQSQWATLADRAYININGAFQGTTDRTFTGTLTEQLYDEPATYELTEGLSLIHI